MTEPILIVSPHLDDAVLSVGQLMHGRPDTVVATVLTGTPNRHRMATSFDRNAGFSNAGHAMEARRKEDAAALVELGAKGMHLGLLDSQYTDGHPPPCELLADAIDLAVREALGDLDEPLLLAPLGLAHPDHVAVADACLEVHRRQPHVQLWAYEELPARVVWPELVPDRLARLREAGYDPVLAFLGTGSIHTKHQAMLAYRSQLAALDLLGHFPHTVLAPERVWRCWPT